MQRATFYIESNLLSFIRPEVNNIFSVYNAKGVQLLTRLRVDFSHVKERKFLHNFVDAINPGNLDTVETLLNQQHTFFFTVLTFLIKD